MKKKSGRFRIPFFCNLKPLYELTLFSVIANNICDAGKTPIRYQKLKSCHERETKKITNVDHTFMQ